MKNILSILSIILVLFSCSEDYVELDGGDHKNNSMHSRISSDEDYYNFFNPKTENFILVEDLRNLQGDIIENNIYSHSHTGLPVQLKLNSITLSGENVMNTGYYNFSNNTFDAESVFVGNFVNASLDNNIIEIDSDSKNSENYLPKFISNFRVSSNEVIGKGSTLTWEADRLNDNGILMGIEYSPTNQADSQIVSNYPDNISMFSTIADRGSYIVKEEDLEKFPDGAFLTFYIGRIERIVKVDPSTKMDLTVNFYTAIREDYKLSKR
ncbi:MAG: hypothetical protein ABS44_08715 [Chryseobacterium sp. SCN 40-13]|mgnify:CR=1 FL=1|nr:MAG: hypothetical protein ABS44_08715 [Chryseobacterium sp. SCN 40-13]